MEPESLVDSKFLLETKLDNPTRMTLGEISEYWKHWVLQMDQGFPFAFLHISGKGGQAGDGDDGDDGVQPSDKAMSPLLFTIDQGFLPPTQCNEDSSERTQYLLSLVDGDSQGSRIFRAIVKMVETLEVSCVEYDFYHISQNFRIRTSQASIPMANGSSYCGHGTVCTCLKKSMGAGSCLIIF